MRRRLAIGARRAGLVACAVLTFVRPSTASGQQVIAGHVVPRVDDGVTLVINVPQRMLFRFEDSEAVDAHPIGVGRRDWPTPTGNFEVISKEIDPAWDVPLSIQQEMRKLGQTPVTRVPPGPGNPLGSRWIGLSLRNIGIHGTTDPSSIYRASTHGCIRLGAAALAALYERVEVGAKGRVIYEPLLLTRTPDAVFLEAHPDVYRRAGESGLKQVARQAAALGVTADVDWDVVAKVIRERKGTPVNVSRLDPRY